MSEIVITTERLVLREIHEADYEALSCILQDSETMYALDMPFTDEQVIRFIHEMQTHYGQRGFGYWAISEKESQELIGIGGLMIEEADGTEHVGVVYTLDKNHWGNGYATEAADACIEYGFSAFQFHEITAQVKLDNEKSRAVAERLGMLLKMSFSVEREDSYDKYLLYGKESEGRPVIRPLDVFEREEQMAVLEAIWEDSVRETHDFLSEEDILNLRPQVSDGISNVEKLFCYENEKGEILGFMGIDGDKIEMLFISPESRGFGIGKKFVRYGTTIQKVTCVDVNEQNSQAVGFYEHLGFNVTSRSETDKQGLNFPILHMKN